MGCRSQTGGGGGAPDASRADGSKHVDAPNGSADGPNGAAKRVFLTSLAYSGDLKTAGGGIDGVDGADKLCQLHAAAGSLGGTWRAWVSTHVLDAIDHVQGDGPWSSIEGTHVSAVVFPNRASLQTAPNMPVYYDEHGDDVPSGDTAWTGTSTGGEVTPDDNIGRDQTCAGWTSADSGMLGMRGELVSDVGWTMFLNGICSANTNNHLYCFEQ